MGVSLSFFLPLQVTLPTCLWPVLSVPPPNRPAPPAGPTFLPPLPAGCRRRKICGAFCARRTRPPLSRQKDLQLEKPSTPFGRGKGKS